MDKVGARVSEANVDLSRLVQEKNDAIRQPADISQTVEMIKARLVVGVDGSDGSRGRGRSEIWC